MNQFVVAVFPFLDPIFLLACLATFVATWGLLTFAAIYFSK